MSTRTIATRITTLLLVLLIAALPLSGCGDDETGEDTAAQDTGLNTEVLVPLDTNGPDGDGSVVVPDTNQPVDTNVEDTWTPPEPGQFGYSCDGHDDCNSGWCIQTADGRQCTKACASDCPSDYDCLEAPGTDATFICIPRFIHLCDPCNETVDCNGAGQAGNYCLGYGAEGKFCGALCTGDTDCPGSYVCRDVPVGGGGTAMQCVPENGAECGCSPLAKSLQLSTTCFWENENGKCEGNRFCTQSGLNSCDAQQPFPESCNGLDDNCNGAEDEFSPDYVCQIANEFGSCPGAGECNNGVESCVGEAAKPETCNLIDDDCDGQTDEDICDDQNPCTIDFCDSDGNCAHNNDDTQLCDDGTVCTQLDKCSGGTCVGYNPMVCGSGDPCYDDVCDPTVGCLSSFANGVDCEDGEPCTTGDSCNQGVCVAGSATDCDDGNPCTIDSCTPGVGCTHTNAPNSSVCGGAGECSQGTCSNGACIGTPIREGLSCSMGGVSACQDSVCQAGNCTRRNKPAGTVCGTTEVCSSCLNPFEALFGCCFGAGEVQAARVCDAAGGCTGVIEPGCQSAGGGGGCGPGTFQLEACGLAFCVEL